jgi:hypothetical protein
MNTQTDSDQKESVRMAYEAHMAHYKSIRQDIIQWSGFQNNLVNYSIAVIGGSVVLFSIQTSQGRPILNDYPFIQLVVSFLLSMITWASLEAEIHIHDTMEYSDRVLRKKVQRLIGRDMPDEFLVLRADIAEVSKTQVARSIFRGILVSGKFLVAYIPAVAYLLLYVLSFPSLPGTPWYVYVLLWLAVVAVVMVPVGLVSQLLFITKHYWGDEQPAQSTKPAGPSKHSPVKHMKSSRKGKNLV